MIAFLLVGLGGIVGAICRYIVSKWSETRWQGWFPAGTFIVNFLGSFILGLLIGFSFTGRITSENIMLLLGTGFTGSFTTFSTFSVEVVSLIKRERFLMAIRYPLITLLVGLSAAALGVGVTINL